ncbi:DUF3443 family protein [Paraburkholderia sediminicola]|uniref:DUF3443 family protein n=1 Tax=Paraburkholderia sediminicola TaxID=458836 RepID=UPI0038BB385B
MKTFNKALQVALLAASVVLSACGGGSSSNSGSTSNSGIDWAAQPSWPITPTTPSTPDAPADANTVPIAVDRSMGSVNLLAVTLTVCPPSASNASQCETIPNMLLDTGSVGVRVTAGAISRSLKSKLLLQVGATDDASQSYPIAECALFGSGFTWGQVRRADVTIGPKQARNIPIQIIDDGAYATPQDCISSGPKFDMPSGFNGIVGIGHSVRDYPGVADKVLPVYYYCQSSAACYATRVSLDKQVMNPVAAFTASNNGTIIRLPALPAGGQASVTGELVFGVGTQGNNALPSNANVMMVDQYGYFTTEYQGRAFINSAIDSGTNGFAFPDSTIPTTGEWFTPARTLSLSASLEATNGAGTPIPLTFSIDNFINVTANGYAAYDSVGMYFSDMYLWGLPFFYGRNVYTVLEGAKVGTQVGPFVAF